MSQFAFLRPEWPEVFEAAARAELSVHPDPRTACFYARRALELAIYWAFKHDSALQLPYQDSLSALLHDPTFIKTAGETIFTKARLITKLGNQAVHSQGQIPSTDAITALKELFHFAYWFARTYSRAARPAPTLTFDPARLPQTVNVTRQTFTQLQQVAADLAARDEKLREVLADRNALDAELTRIRAEVAEAKRAASSLPDAHDYSEAETRDAFIDILLHEAGWPLRDGRDREFEVSGMPNQQGRGFVDYVLWGEDGKPLGLVEAKRTRRSVYEGEQQAKLYADCLERMFGQRPLIFLTNGYQHHLWDDQRHPPRPVQGFLTQAELELAIQRRTSRASLSAAAINPTIVERPYQTRAIRRIAETFEKHNRRRALLVMATGSGKTRTVIALADLLMRANWAKRVLFLADRRALVKQAVDAFKKFLPESSPVNLVTEKNTEGRVYVSTYPTITGLIDETSDGVRRFGVGHFDLIIIDEAHRSVYQKYGAIFDYFDSYLVGLTATPREEVDRDTYRLFHLETGVPTDVYGLEEAVEGGYLVPPRSVSVPLRFPREGIRYHELSAEEREEWDAVEWDDEGNVPDRVEAEAVNQWLFNTDTVDKVLQFLMERGQKVNAGDTLGKTILFAKNQAHAEFIAERFNHHYPHYNGEFARIITFKTEYAQTLIDNFSDPKRWPQIAISVDMLDTGIDVPEVVNLVFFKLVRSKTKFWQMVGRGTRLSPDLFGPGLDKQFFYIFDFCQNLEFFSQNPEASDGSLNEPLGKRIFLARMELITELDTRNCGDPEKHKTLRTETAELLRDHVAAMNLDNFIVRPHRLYVERYREAEAWSELTLDRRAELAEHIAGLPTQIEDPDIDAKQFDYLLLRLQLSLLQSGSDFQRLRERVEEIAGLLAEKQSIPMVSQQMQLILDLQTQAFWDGITAPILEDVRKKLRGLIKFIEKAKRKPVYTGFEDTLGTPTEIALPGITANTFARFREKVRAFLRTHENDPAIIKLREAQPLTTEDLASLEQMLLRAGLGTVEEIRQARETSAGFGLFLRSLTGLSRQAAHRAFEQFLTGRRPTANQIEFINMVIEHLTEQGFVDPGLLYESPFTDTNPQGVEGLFPNPTDQDQIFNILNRIRLTAAPPTAKAAGSGV